MLNLKDVLWSLNALAVCRRSMRWVEEAKRTQSKQIFTPYSHHEMTPRGFLYHRRASLCGSRRSKVGIGVTYICHRYYSLHTTRWRYGYCFCCTASKVNQPIPRPFLLSPKTKSEAFEIDDSYEDDGECSLRSPAEYGLPGSEFLGGCQDDDGTKSARTTLTCNFLDASRLFNSPTFTASSSIFALSFKKSSVFISFLFRETFNHKHHRSTFPFQPETARTRLQRRHEFRRRAKLWYEPAGGHDHCRLHRHQLGQHDRVAGQHLEQLQVLLRPLLLGHAARLLGLPTPRAWHDALLVQACQERPWSVHHHQHQLDLDGDRVCAGVVLASAPDPAE